VGAYDVRISAYGIPCEDAYGLKIKRLGVFSNIDRHGAFYRALTAPWSWVDISTNPGYLDVLQMWVRRAIDEHLSTLVNEYPTESQEFTTWLNSFSETVGMVTIGEHEWESGLDS